MGLTFFFFILFFQQCTASMQHLAAAKPPLTLMANPKGHLCCRHLTCSTVLQLHGRVTFRPITLIDSLTSVAFQNMKKKKSIGIEQIREIRVHFLSMILHKLETLSIFFFFFFFYLVGNVR